MKEGNSVKAMLAFREKLPAFKVKSEFLKAVTNNQVDKILHVCRFHVSFHILEFSYLLNSSLYFIFYLLTPSPNDRNFGNGMGFNAKLVK